MHDSTEQSSRASRASAGGHAMGSCKQKGSPGAERLPVHLQGHNELQHPSHALLEEQGFDKVTYSTYRERCLADRADLGAHPEPWMHSADGCTCM